MTHCRFVRPCLVLLTALLPCLSARGQEDAPAEPAPAGKTRAQLEEEFAALLTGSQLVGSFTDDARPDAPLQRDRYTIHKVEKIKGDLWRFDARIEYAGRDVTVPIPLYVKWAGDTPVITLTDFAVPGLGTYTARVLFYRGQYAGTWSGSTHGGQMFGRVVKSEVKEGGEADAGESDGSEADDSDGSIPGGGERETAAQAAPAAPAKDVNWPQFHGPHGTGVADGHSLPVEWDVEQGKNILWRAGIPGLSHSSPVVWGGLVFVTSAERDEEASLRVGLYGNIESVPDEGEHTFTLYCIEKQTGDILWAETCLEAAPKIKRHTKGSHAASSPATDGEHVVAFFGTEGLYCYDMDGILIWDKQFGLLDSGYYMVKDAQWGFGSSPVIHAGMVILQCDVQENSFVTALDVRTGEEIWRTPRDEVPTWGTPTVAVKDGRAQVICNGWRHIGGYDLKTGEELWKLVGGGDIPVPTPVVAHDMAFITSSHGPMQPIYAISLDAEGELSMDPEECSHMAWSQRNLGNYMPTPVVYGDYLYLGNDSGILSCYRANTGEQVYRERVGQGRSGFTASNVAGDGKLYLTSEDGDVYVVKAGPEFEILSVNDMGSTCMASPAISEGILLLRTRNELVAIAGGDGAE